MYNEQRERERERKKKKEAYYKCMQHSPCARLQLHVYVRCEQRSAKQKSQKRELNFALQCAVPRRAYALCAVEKGPRRRASQVSCVARFEMRAVGCSCVCV